jgi:hypothetical protein
MARVHDRLLVLEQAAEALAHLRPDSGAADRTAMAAHRRRVLDRLATEFATESATESATEFGPISARISTRSPACEVRDGPKQQAT